MTQYVILSLLIFFLSFVFLSIGLKSSPRSRLVRAYREKQSHADSAFKRNDMISYKCLSQESSEFYEMIRRYDEHTYLRRF